MTTTTTLPAPTADACTRAGVWPHMPALRRELTELVADLDPVDIPRGPDARDIAEAMIRSGWRRLMVGVYAPLGRDEAWLGWYPRERVGEVVARVVDYLPGARARERESAHDSLAVVWGSRTPGWSLTAVRVWRQFEYAWREPGDLWGTAACAEHCGIRASTWRSYQSRRDAGIPIPYGEAVLPGASRPVPVWDRQRVIDWNAGRPGRGGRPAQ